MKRTAGIGLLVLGLLVLLILGPTRIQGWAGRAWNQVTVSETQPAAEPALESTNASTSGKGGNHLVPPAVPEFVAQTARGSCADCEPWLSAFDYDTSDLSNEQLDPVEDESGSAGNDAGSLFGQSSAGGANGGNGARGPRSAGGGAGAGGGGVGGGGSSASDSGGSETDEVQGSSSDDQESASSSNNTADNSNSGKSNDGISSGTSPNGGGQANGGPNAGGSGPSGASSGPSQAPQNLVLGPITGGGSPLGGNTPPVHDAELPGVVADALLTSPVGSETIYSEGDASKVSDQMKLSSAPTTAGDNQGGEADIVPEPASLLLFGIGLTAAARLRQRSMR
jgi:hypothetical protein